MTDLEEAGITVQCQINRGLSDAAFETWCNLLSMVQWLKT